jgi:hypothetical protein
MAQSTKSTKPLFTSENMMSVLSSKHLLKICFDSEKVTDKIDFIRKTIKEMSETIIILGHYSKNIKDLPDDLLLPHMYFFFSDEPDQKDKLLAEYYQEKFNKEDLSLLGNLSIHSQDNIQLHVNSNSSTVYKAPEEIKSLPVVHKTQEVVKPPPFIPLIPDNPYDDLSQKTQLATKAVSSKPLIDETAPLLDRKIMETLHTGSVELRDVYDSTRDYKSIINLHVMKAKTCQPPRFQLKSQTGPSNTPTFVVEMEYRGQWFYVKHQGNRKEAEQILAQKACEIEGIMFSQVASFNRRKDEIMFSQAATYDKFKEDHFTTQMRRVKAVKYHKTKIDFDKSYHSEPIRHKKKTFDEEVESFHTYLVSHGYTADNMKDVPKHLITQAFQLYISGYGMMNLHKIKRLQATEQRLFQRDLAKLPVPSSTPQKGTKVRRAIVRGYRDLFPHENGEIFGDVMKSQGLREFVDRMILRFRRRNYEDHNDHFPPPPQPPQPGIVAQAAQHIGSNVAVGFLDQIKNQLSTMFSGITTFLSEHSAKIGAFVSVLGTILMAIVIVGVFGIGMLYLLRFWIMGLSWVVGKTAYALFVSNPLPTENLEDNGEDDDTEMKSQALSDYFNEGILEKIARIMDSGVEKGQRFFAGFTKVAVSFNSLSTFVSSVSTLCKKAVDYVYEWITGVPYFTDTKLAKEITQVWTELYHKMTDADKTNYDDRDFCRGIIREYERLDRLMHDVAYLKLEQRALQQIMHFRMHIVQQVRHCYQTVSKSGGRQEPIWVNLCGPPKQGKSLLLKALLSGLFSSLGLGKMDYSNIYSRRPEEEYWSGYTGQWAVIIDDMFQSTDPQKRGREADQMIGMVNTIPYPLIMAGLDDKGCTFFNSKVVFTTTNSINDANLLNIGLQDKEALFRRRTLNVHVKLKNGVPSTNIASLSRDQFDNDYELELWTRVKDNAGNDCVRKQPITTMDLLKMMKREYEIRARSFKMQGNFCTCDWSDISPPPNPNSPNSPPPPPGNPPDKPPVPPADDLDHMDIKLPEGTVEIIVPDEDNEEERRKAKPIRGRKQEKRDRKKQKKVELPQTGLTILETDDDEDNKPEPKKEEIPTESDETMKSQVLDHEFSVLWTKPCILSDNGMCTTHSHVSMSFQNLCSHIMGSPRCYYNCSVELWRKVQFMNRNSRAAFDVVYYKHFYRWQPGFRFVVQPGNQTLYIAIQHRDGPVISAARLCREMNLMQRVNDIHPDDQNICFYEMCDPIWSEGLSHLGSPTVRARISQELFGSPSFCKTITEFCVDEGIEIEQAYQVIRDLFPHADYRHPMVIKEILPCLLRPKVVELSAMTTAFIGAIGYVTLFALAGATLAFLRAMGIVLITWWCSDTSQSYDKAAAKQSARILKKRQGGPPRRKMLKSQMSDENAETLAEKLLSRNVYWTKFHVKGGKHYYGYLTFIQGSIAATAGHVVSGGLEKVEVYYNAGEDESVELQPDFVKIHADRDLAIIRFKDCQPHKDFYKHLPEKMIDVKTEGPGRVTILKGDRCYVKGSYMVPRTRKTTLGGSVQGYYVVGAQGEDGECGAPYVLFNPAFDKKLVGIHIAGNNYDSLVAPILRSDIDEAREFNAENATKDEIMISNCIETDIMIPGETGTSIKPDFGYFHPGMRVVGKSNTNFTFPGATQLAKTPIAKGAHCNGIWMKPPYPLTTAPAKLRPGIDSEGIERDPLKLSLRKLLGKRTKLPPPEIGDMDVWDGVFPDDMFKHELKLLTIEEAVFGVPEINLPGIDISTSSAFPFSAHGIKREELINKDTKFIHPCIRKAVEYRITEALAGRIVPMVAIGTLKDETRPLDRVDKFYTRIFENGELDHLIFCRMAIGAIMIAVEKCRTGDIQVGLNPYSSHWRILYERMIRFGKQMKNIVDHDVSGWDLNYVFYIAHHYVRQLRKRGIITDENWLCIIFSALISSFSVYIVIGTMVVWTTIMPSGCLVTSFFNSILNSVKHRIIFKRQSREQFGFPLKFENHNELLVFGDDDNHSIDPEILNWFNGQIIAEQAKLLFNHEHTDSLKSAIIPRGRSEDEIVFLQRKYVNRDGHIMAPLNPESLISMTQWVRKSKEFSVEHQFMLNAHNALMEWSQHGKKEFEKHKAILNVFLRAAHQPQFTKEYVDCIDFFQVHYTSN